MVTVFGKDGEFVFPPRAYPLGDTGELDPVTFQPLVGKDYDNPQIIGLFVKGAPYKLFGLIPADRHFIGATDGTVIHFLGTDKLGRDVLSRILYGSRISLLIALTVVTVVTVVGTSVGMTSGYFGGPVDAWIQRFVELVLAFPQLPFYLALASLIPVTAPTKVFLGFVIAVMSALALGADVTRGARQDDGAGAYGLCAGGHRRGRDRQAHHLPPYPAERDEPRHCCRHTCHSHRRAA